MITKKNRIVINTGGPREGATRLISTGQPMRGALPPFSVPPGVKYLDPAQLAALTESFRQWCQQSPRPAERRARGRVWLTFLVIRYTGAKLGETVAIDERNDLDLDRGVLTLRAARGDRSPREVHLPPEVVEQLRASLADLPDTGASGRVFGLDPGFVRRKFYERAEACSIPRDLASPQVIRASRALELLHGGMPLPVVQRILGQRTVNLTASYVDYEPGDVSRIFQAHLLDELRARTSARNLFAGRITTIHRGGILSEVTLETSEGHRVTSVITNTSLENLRLAKGAPVFGMIKAPLVAIVKAEELPAASAQNLFPGRVTGLHSDGIMAEVVSSLEGGVEVCALITAVSAKRMQLAPGDRVWVVFDASAVVLWTPTEG